jgi:sugar lactone lactonase YvrE
MNHEPFDDDLSWELRSLVADADPPPTLRPATGGPRRQPGRPLILIGCVAAAVLAVVGLLVAPGDSHRQRVASGAGSTTTTESGVLAPLPGNEATPSSLPANPTTTAGRAPTTLPFISGKSGPTTTVPQSLAMTHYSLGDSIYWGITQGPDGNMWAVSWVDIARITPDGKITKFAIRSSVPSMNSPAGITAGPDGNLWFTEWGADKVGRITTGGLITEFATPAFGEITAAPDGNLWFPAGNNRIGKITTAGSAKSFPVAGGVSGGIARGSDGNVWFGAANSIGRITPAGVVTQFPAQHSYRGAAAGPDGNVWFQSEDNGGTIGRVTPAGEIKDFGGAGGSAWATSITAGPDGNVWCVESPGHLVFRIDRSGTVTAFSSDRADTLNQYGIAPGPGGTLWVIEDRSVAKFSPPPA